MLLYRRSIPATLEWVVEALGPCADIVRVRVDQDTAPPCGGLHDGLHQLSRHVRFELTDPCTVPYYPPCQRIEPNTDLSPQQLLLQQHQLADMASRCAASPRVAPVSNTVSSVVSTVTDIVSLSVQARPCMERFSVSLSHHPLSRLNPASFHNPDSASSYQSSLSSMQSPVSPTHQATVPCYRDSHSSCFVNQADPGQQCHRFASPLAAPRTALQPSPLPVNRSEQSVASLYQPSSIYATMQEATSAAPVAANTAVNGGSPVSATAAEKRKGGVVDTGRRLKHRVVDANRRQREMVVVERLATLSGQRDEPQSRDRATTLEVACDRYEELTWVVEEMRVKMCSMEEQLQALGGARKWWASSHTASERLLMGEHNQKARGCAS